jgi:hypothetical protein
MKSKTIEQVLENGALSRRNLLVAATTAGAALAVPGSAIAGMFGKKKQGLNDYDILNFALNLEYLEAEFYSYATTGVGISSTLFTGTVGTPGPTVGGHLVNFANTKLQEVAEEIAKDELEHVTLLRSALGTYAVAKPAINLNALGLGFNGADDFLTLSRAFEDTGVSAYGGAATYISSPAYLQVAAQILAVEAYHSGNIRYQIAKTTPGFKIDSMDIPPTVKSFFPTDSNGLAVIRTPAEVLLIVRGPNASGGNFFPNGLNGTIR